MGIHSCPTNLGTGMRASVHVDLPGWTAESVDKLKARCEELAVQPRGTKGESGGQTGHTYDISNKHRLGYSEVQLVQVMIDAVNTLWKEDLEFQRSTMSASKRHCKLQNIPVNNWSILWKIIVVLLNLKSIKSLLLTPKCQFHRIVIEFNLLKINTSVKKKKKNPLKKKKKKKKKKK